MAPSPKTSGADKKAAQLFTAAGGQPTPRKNFVKRLLHGEFSLTITFWIFCISIPLLAHLAFSRLIFPVLDVRTWYGSTVFLLWPILTVLYAAVACTGLWRCRSRFSGNPLWPNIAGLAALLGPVGAVAYAAMLAGSWFMLASV